MMCIETDPFDLLTEPATRGVQKKAVLKNFIFTGKHLCWSLFINKTLQHRYFLVNIEKFLRTPTLKNIYERLLLY